MIKSIRKRDGKIVPFDQKKIINAIYKASVAVGEPNWSLSENLSKEVIRRLNKKLKKNNIPSVEEVQDTVEQILIDTAHARIAKAYILYRQHRAAIRQEKKQILNKAEIDEVDKKFDINALRVLASRYLKKDENGKIIESPKELFERVSVHASLPSLFYDSRIFQKQGKAPEHREEEFEPEKFAGKFSIGKYKLNQFHLEALKRLYDRFAKSRKIKVSWSAFLNLLKKGYFDKYESEVNTYYNLMVERKFFPNTPALANFGNYLGMGSACFSLGIDDSIDSIMDTLKSAAIIFKAGGGVGYNFSHLRPEGDFVKTTGGAASGPISFMSMFDNMTDVIKQGGCVSTDTLIRTDKGVMPIKNLLRAPEFKENQTNYFVYDGQDYHHAFLAMNNGSTEVYEITTELGNKLKATFNHLITVVHPETGNLTWKKVKDLEIGDWVVTILGGHSGKDIYLPAINNKPRHFNAHKIKTPEFMNENLAEILGLYMADGCINNGRFIFSVDAQDKDLSKRIIWLMKEVFGLSLGSRWKKADQNYLDLVFYSKDLEKYFEEMNWKKKGAKEAFIPYEIFLSKPKIAAAFLRGLFEGDGTIHSDGYPLLTSISKRLIYEVQQLLLGLGLVSKIRKQSILDNKKHQRFGSNDIYILTILTDRSIEKFKKEIGFISKRKNRNLNKYFYNKQIEYSDLIPYVPEIFAKYYQWVGRGCGKAKSKKGANILYYRAVQHYLKGDRQLTRKTLKKLFEKFEFLKNDEILKNLADEKYFFTRITKINQLDNEKTMEIEVPASASYVANGFLVHNIRRGANMGILNCLAGSVRINTLEGKKPIKDLENKFVYVYSYDHKSQNIKIRKAYVYKTGEKREVWRVILDNDESIVATPDHKFLLSNGGYKELRYLKQGDSLMAFYKFLDEKNYVRVGITGKNYQVLEHLLVAELILNRPLKTNERRKRRPDDETVHHLDGIRINNHPDNLQILTVSEHARLHSNILLENQKRIAIERKGKKLEEIYDKELVKRWKERMSVARQKKIPWNKGLATEIYKSHYQSGFKNQFSNHKVKKIEFYGFEDVYDLTVPDLHNFAAEDIFVHNCNHPDIEKFIKAKEGNKALRNFNISVMIMPDFFSAYKEDKPYPLINPRTQKIVREINPKKLFDLIAYQVWESAEPGVLFFDRINEYNPFLKSLGPIEATNPCSELPLYPYESCNLGSINVWAYIKKNGDKKPHFDWQKLEQDIKIITRFLDNVIDVNKYPLKEIEEMTLSTRKIGLGVMGVGDLLYELEIPYGSKQSLAFMEKLMEFINYYSKETSVELSKERGRMPYFDKSFYKEGKLPFSGSKDRKSWHFDWPALIKKIKKYGIRNAGTTTIAPTGSISMLAGTSSGIEPVYSLVFEKSVTVGSFYYVDPVFEEAMRKAGLMDDDLITDTARFNGSIRHISYIPEKYKKIFVTAMDIAPADHIKVVATFQKWVDSSISKTINFPAEATIDDIKKAYLLAYELGCKGVTIYRDKSLTQQVLIGGSVKKKAKETSHLAVLKDEKAKGLAVYHEASAEINEENSSLSSTEISEKIKKDIKNCPSCQAPLAKQEGCVKCLNCGWGLCSS